MKAPSRTIRRYLAILIAAIPLSSVLLHALDPSRAITQYRIDSWTRNDGLPQNAVEAITQTPDGYLWIGTQQGLARFDGVRFTVFNTRNSEHFSDDYVAALLRDEEGTLWIGTDSGLFSYRDGRFTLHPAAATEKGVASLYEDRDGTIWVGARKGPLATLRDGEVRPFTDADGAVLAGVLAIAQDSAGRLCFASRRFQCLEEGRFREYDMSAATSAGRAVTTVAVDREDRFWLGTQGDGIVEMEDGAFQGFESGPGGAGSTIFRVFVDRAGEIWGGTGTSGLIRRSEHGFQVLGDKAGLSQNLVKAIFEDREGSLWIGTNGGGLNRLTDRKFTTFSVPEGLSHSFVHSVLEDRSGSLWVGTGEGLNRITAGAVTHFDEKDGLGSPVILGLWGDREGKLWVGTGNGIFRFDGAHFEHYPPARVVFALYQDREGGMWAGGVEGIYRLEDGRFVKPGWAAGFGLTSSITGDREGNLWFGVFHSGLVKYADGRVTVFSTENGLGDNSVLGIHVDERDVVWFATHGGGLHRLQGDRITVFTMDDGLPCQNLFWILEDDSGNLWVTCNDGVFSVPRKQLDEVADGARRSVDTVLYGRGDGMRNSECNGGQQPAGWKSADGRLWFPTGDGLVSINPGNIHRNETPPPTVIERILIDDVEYNAATSERAFPPGQGRLQFEYTGLSLIAPEEVRFRYRLEGFDEDWIEAGARRTAFYTNIPPGRYTFRVRAANNDGVWNEAGAVFPFRLRPHYYQTVWFYALIVLMLGLAAYAFHRYRLGRVLELERVRTRIATDLHDDIGASLSQIAILSEVVGRRMESADPAVGKPLSRIAASSRELVDSMSDIVWAVNPKRDRLRDVIQRMRRFASDTLSSKEIAFTFEAPDSSSGLRLGADIQKTESISFSRRA